jgi:putative photosynthetic complex assembly protein
MLLGITLCSVAAVRLAGPAAPNPFAEASIESRDLRFTDRIDGAVVALEGPENREVAVIAPGTNGFLRGVLRGLARERKSMNIGDQVAFRIVRRSGGRLAIEDLATGRRVDLEAFGPTNTEAFSRLLRREKSPGMPEGMTLQASLQARTGTGPDPMPSTGGSTWKK